MKHLTYLFLLLFVALATEGCASKCDLARVDHRLARVEGQIQCLETTTQPAPVQVVLPPDMLKGIDQSLRDNSWAIRSVSCSIKKASPDAGLRAIAAAVSGLPIVGGGSEPSQLYLEIKALLSDLSNIAEKILIALEKKSESKNPLVDAAREVINKALEKLTEKGLDWLLDHFLAPAAAVAAGLAAVKPPPKLPQRALWAGFWIVACVGLIFGSSYREISFQNSIAAPIIKLNEPEAGSPQRQQATPLPTPWPTTDLSGVTLGLSSIQQELHSVAVAIGKEHPVSGPTTCPNDVTHVVASGEANSHPLEVMLVAKDQCWWWLAVVSAVLTPCLALETWVLFAVYRCLRRRKCR